MPSSSSSSSSLARDLEAADYSEVPSEDSFFRDVNKAEYLEGVSSRLQSYESLGITSALLAGFAVAALIELDADDTESASFGAAILCWTVAAGLNLAATTVFAYQAYFGTRLTVYAALFLQKLHVGFHHAVLDRQWMARSYAVRRAAVWLFLASFPALLGGLGMTVVARFDSSRRLGYVVCGILAVFAVVIGVSLRALAVQFEQARGDLVSLSQAHMGARFANFTLGDVAARSAQRQPSRGPGLAARLRRVLQCGCCARGGGVSGSVFASAEPRRSDHHMAMRSAQEKA